MTVTAEGLAEAAAAAQAKGATVALDPGDALLITGKLVAGERVAATLRRYHLDRLEELGHPRVVPCKGSCHVCISLLEWRNTLALGQPALVPEPEQIPQDSKAQEVDTDEPY